ncbi:MAG: ribosome small subunit-dependent GTPase A [Longimicrobiaceae bacterium]
MTGRVLCALGGAYEVETGEGVVVASLRGRLKREGAGVGPLMAGDEVEVAGGDGGWTVERIFPRRSELVRRAPGRAPRSKPIAANVDQAAVVFAAARPEPNLFMLDRFLVVAEQSGVLPFLVVNKIDLADPAVVESRFAPYRNAGYRLLLTCAKDGRGVADLRRVLHDRTTVFTGPSGVGKSRLLNSVYPGLGLRVGEAGFKGRHTTVTARLIPIPGGGYVADTPGLREIGLWALPAAGLDRHFPELRPHLGGCRFDRSCTHTHESGCRVREAVDAGTIPPERYQSYRRMLANPAGDRRLPLPV